MTRTTLFIGLLTCFVSAKANLITDGSFESPVAPAGSFDNFVSGSTGITG